jgi:hypothetical protein
MAHLDRVLLQLCILNLTPDVTILGGIQSQSAIHPRIRARRRVIACSPQPNDGTWCVLVVRERLEQAQHHYTLFYDGNHKGGGAIRWANGLVAASSSVNGFTGHPEVQSLVNTRTMCLFSVADGFFSITPSK